MLLTGRTKSEEEKEATLLPLFVGRLLLLLLLVRAIAVVLFLLEARVTSRLSCVQIGSVDGAAGAMVISSWSAAVAASCAERRC